MQGRAFGPNPRHTTIRAVFAALKTEDLVDCILCAHASQACASRRNVVGASRIPNGRSLAALLHSHRQDNLDSLLQLHSAFNERMRQTRSTSVRSRSVILVNSTL